MKPDNPLDFDIGFKIKRPPYAVDEKLAAQYAPQISQKDSLEDVNKRKSIIRDIAKEIDNFSISFTLNQAAAATGNSNSGLSVENNKKWFLSSVNLSAINTNTADARVFAIITNAGGGIKRRLCALTLPAAVAGLTTPSQTSTVELNPPVDITESDSVNLRIETFSGWVTVIFNGWREDKGI